MLELSSFSHFVRCQIMFSKWTSCFQCIKSWVQVLRIVLTFLILVLFDVYFLVESYGIRVVYLTIKVFLIEMGN